MTTADAGVVAIAAVVTAVVGRRLTSRSVRRSPHPHGVLASRVGPARRLPAHAVIGLLIGAVVGGALLVGPVPVAAVGGAAGTVRGLAARRRRQARVRAVADALPQLVDLFVVAAAAGVPPTLALGEVARGSPSALRAAVDRAAALVAAGGPFAQGLRSLEADLGAQAADLVRVLRSGVRDGTPLLGPLRDVARVARDRRRRAAEERARRLPVALLFPLAGCILPAVFLLAVVPVLAASVADLAG